MGVGGRGVSVNMREQWRAREYAYWNVGVWEMCLSGNGDEAATPNLGCSSIADLPVPD